MTLALACDQGAGSGAGEPVVRKGTAAEQRVAASVNGVEIPVDDVAATASWLRVAPRDALERLIGEQLLIAEAQRRGFDRAPGVDRVATQAAVQTLLAQAVERETVSEADVIEAYANQRSRFEIPEKRKSLHVLFSLPRPTDDNRERAGRRLAERAVEELANATDPARVWERYRDLGTVEGFEVKAEDIPPASRVDNFAVEYLDALFSLAEPGVVKVPARTNFGWHAIVVTDIVAPQFTPLAEAHATLRRELLKARKAAALDTLVREVSAAHPVERNEGAINALLHADAAASEAPAP